LDNASNRYAVLKAAHTNAAANVTMLGNQIKRTIAQVAELTGLIDGTTGELALMKKKREDDWLVYSTANTGTTAKALTAKLMMEASIVAASTGVTEGALHSAERLKLVDYNAAKTATTDAKAAL